MYCVRTPRFACCTDAATSPENTLAFLDLYAATRHAHIRSKRAPSQSTHVAFNAQLHTLPRGGPVVITKSKMRNLFAVLECKTRSASSLHSSLAMPKELPSQFHTSFFSSIPSRMPCTHLVQYLLHKRTCKMRKPPATPRSYTRAELRRERFRPVPE